MSLREQVTQPADPSYRLIGLTQGKIAIVDAADFEWLSRWVWYAQKNQSSGAFYAVRFSRDPKPRLIYMHRQIAGDPVGLLVDHKDRDSLNNRRTNLRPATKAQNTQNSVRKRGKTGFRGVAAQNGMFIAQIGSTGKTHYLGTFWSKEEAHEAYKKAARELHGDFARFE